MKLKNITKTPSTEEFYKISARRSLLQMTTKGLLFLIGVTLMTLGRSAFAQTYTVQVPTLSPNESVVAFATPQNYGAKGDGVTDDTAAFQNAINAAKNAGGGIIYVPKATYAFNGNLTLPGGVSLHGDWTDWTTGTGGCVGTTFKILGGAGQATGNAFITMNVSTGLTGINFWYPNQNPNSITPYPFTVHAAGDAFIQNIVLVNSYQGIDATSADHHVIQTVIGSPLFIGFLADNIFDVCHVNDFRFSPNVWPASKLAGAPAAGGSYATWMRTNGTGMRLVRVDGEFSYGITISGYKVGIEMNDFGIGGPSCSMYEGNVTNCATALLAQHGATNGMPFTGCTFDGDVGISRTVTGDLRLEFDHCTIIGEKGTAVSLWGNDLSAIFQFQNCTITNAINPNGCIFNVVDCTLNGSPQCIMGSNVNTRAYFTGCTFTSGQNIKNYGSTGNLQVISGASTANTLPNIPWSTFTAQYAACKPAKTTLFLSSSYGATGNGTTDDTTAIQNALTAAGNNGGGIVYLLPGHYKTTNTLTVPSGVKLQGTYEGFHGSDFFSSTALGAWIEPYGGQGGTTGPVALALSANSGVVGMTFNYKIQNGATNVSAFPATIQGRGANVYVIGVMAPNPYIFLDLDTYACTNHFVSMIDGYAIYRYVLVGGGSSGSIVDVGGFGGYWTNWAKDANPVANMRWLTMGDCTETVASVFVYGSNSLVYCTAENSKGPNLTCIVFGQDGSISSYTLDSAAASTINFINAGNALFGNSGVPSSATFFIQATSQFKGTARFFNMSSWAGPAAEFIINGGDVGVECYFADEWTSPGPTVNGGVFHLVNYTDFNSQPYTVTFGANAGISGKTSEVIGNFSYPGVISKNLNSANPVNAWGNYATSSSGPVDGLLCNLLCQSSGMGLDNGGSTSQGSNVLQEPGSGSSNQRWQLADVGGGYYNLINQTSLKALDNANSSSNGTSLIQWTDGGGSNTNQGWQFVNVGGLYPYHLINQKNGKAMDNYGSTTAGAPILQWSDGGGGDVNQNWRVVPISQSLQSGMVYHLVCVTSGMALDNGNSTTAGNPVIQWGDNSNNVNQEWEMVSVGTGYYNLICQKSGMALDDWGGTSNGSPVKQFTLQANNSHQEWSVLPGNGYCSLICLDSGLALDNEGSTTQGNGVWQWTPQVGNTNQEWEFINNEATPQSGSTFNLMCQYGGMALDNNSSTTAGASIVQWPLVYGTASQRWQFVSVGTGIYNLINQYSGMALDNGSATSDGAPVVQQPLQSGATNQQWTFTNQGNDYYSVVCKANGKALDNKGSGTGGTSIAQWSAGPNNSHQNWQLNLLP